MDEAVRIVLTGVRPEEARTVASSLPPDFLAAAQRLLPTFPASDDGWAAYHPSYTDGDAEGARDYVRASIES
ncbi:MAG: hypothetical protein ACKVII_22315, partial [Planctomycetales bacterium]